MKITPYYDETVSRRPKGATSIAVLSSLLTTTGLSTLYVNLHSQWPYYHAHNPLAHLFPRLGPD